VEITTRLYTDSDNSEQTDINFRRTNGLVVIKLYNPERSISLMLTELIKITDFLKD